MIEKPARASPPTSPSFPGLAPELAPWPAEAAAAIGDLIARHAHTGAFAVFDADNTLYQNDLEEALLPFLEATGALTRDTMAQSLRLIPFKDTSNHQESLYSYYDRLCRIDEEIGYAWIAQVFAGFTLDALKVHVDAVLTLDRPIRTTRYDGDQVVSVAVAPPRPLRGQQALVNTLARNGIAVHVVSAAAEELVRMVVSDPRHGYGIPPENVIGATVLLRDQRSGELTTARTLIRQGRYDGFAGRTMELTPHLHPPLPWFAGKCAAILAHIDPWRKPILVAGDTPGSDGPMLFHATDVENGGLRLWIRRSEAYWDQLRAMREHHAGRQAALAHPVTADKNWVVVHPDDLA